MTSLINNKKLRLFLNLNSFLRLFIFNEIIILYILNFYIFDNKNQLFYNLIFFINIFFNYFL